MEEKTNLGTKFLVVFWGSFIPLQGIQYIVRAAKILEKYSNIQFSIIGKGQTYSDVNCLAKKLDLINIEFLGRLPNKEIPDYIARADVCLGIFGDTEKTQRVIPNKVYEAIAMKKPVITADTPAARELFADGKNILFCKIANPQDLAKKILKVRNNPSLREKVAENAYQLFNKKGTSRVLGKKLKDILLNFR